MRSGLGLSTAYAHRAPLRRRAGALLLALATNALIVVMLLRLSDLPSRPAEVKTQLITVQLEEAPPAVAVPDRTEAHAEKPAGGAPPRAPTPEPAPPADPLQMVIVSRDVFAAADISRFPVRASSPQAAAGPAGSGAGDGMADGAGDGPGGERLYDVDWYRKPTQAELATYLPAGVSRGWGMVACQTVERFRVENCRELGDSPPGSGLARAVRQAAWQFRIRPPRIGGRSLVGTWVRIRIDISPESGVEASGR